MGAVVHVLPSVEGDGIPRVHQPPHCCRRCGAFLNPYCRLEAQAGNWKCNFCHRINTEDPNTTPYALQTAPGLTQTAVDYLTSLNGEAAGKLLPEIQVVVFVVDLTFSPHPLHLVAQSIKKVESHLESLGHEQISQAGVRMEASVHVGLVLVDSCVSLCRLDGKEGLLDLHCVPGHTVNMPASLRRPQGGYSSYLCPLESCLDSFGAALDALHTTKATIPERERPRCLGTAIHEALNAVKESREQDSVHSRKERIVVMTCGPPTHGPGAVPSDFMSDDPRHTEAKQHSQELFDRLSDVAVGMNVKVDLYGFSFSPIGLSLIETLPRATNGIISLHSVLTPDLFAAQLTASLERSFGTHGIFDVRLSKGLRLSSIIGPVSERLAPEESGIRQLTNNACLLKSIDKGRSLCLFLEAMDDFGREDVYIQILLSWKERKTGIQVERVITHALSPTGNLQEFLKSVDPVTVGVLMAKKLVIECAELAKKKESAQLENLRNGVAYKLSFMVQKFGKLLESKSGFFGLRQEKKWGCPQELWYIAQSLYHLHKGQLLGQSDLHSEETRFLQSMFLSASLEAADRMLVPKLYSLNATSLSLEELPAISTALRSDHVMLLDHGFYIFIWIGKQIWRDAVPELLMQWVQKCEDYAIEKCQERCLMSELIVVREGVDDASLYRHLTPTHRDPAVDQFTQYSGDPTDATPAVPEIPETDEMSLYEWCRMVSVEPPKLNLDQKSQSLR